MCCIGMKGGLISSDKLALASELLVWRHQSGGELGSLAGAAHLLHINAGVLRQAQ